jgi:hypothetical protein
MKVSKDPTWTLTGPLVAQSHPKPVTEFPHEAEINKRISFLPGLTHRTIAADFVIVLEPSTQKGCLTLDRRREGFASSVTESPLPDSDDPKAQQKLYKFWTSQFNGIDRLCGVLPVCSVPFENSIQILMATVRHFMENPINHRKVLRVIFAPTDENEIPIYEKNLLHYFPLPKRTTEYAEDDGLTEPTFSYIHSDREEHEEEEDKWTIQRCTKCKTIIHDFYKGLGGGTYRPEYQCPVCGCYFCSERCMAIRWKAGENAEEKHDIRKMKKMWKRYCAYCAEANYPDWDVDIYGFLEWRIWVEEEEEDVEENPIRTMITCRNCRKGTSATE